MADRGKTVKTVQMGTDGANGTDGTAPTISINEDGYWGINGVLTNVKAEAINGTNGKDGNTWTVGTDYPHTPNDGDIFLNNNTWEVYQYNGTTWESKGNIKGATGETGAQGPAGNNGQNGSSVFIGYDGTFGKME